MELNYLCITMRAADITKLYQYEMYKLCLIVLLSIIFIFLVSPKIRFSSGISLITSNVATVISVLLIVYCYSISMAEEAFDVWTHETVDLYGFIYGPILLGILQYLYVITFVSIIFLIRCWLKVLFNVKEIRDVLAAFLLFFISVVVGNFQYKIFSDVIHLEGRSHRLAELYVKKYDATEEMTKRHTRKHPNSWSAHYLRAQFLWDTYREEEALLHYEKSLSLLSQGDIEMIRFIETRILGIKKALVKTAGRDLNPQ